MLQDSKPETIFSFRIILDWKDEKQKHAWQLLWQLETSVSSLNSIKTCDRGEKGLLIVDINTKQYNSSWSKALKGKSLALWECECYGCSGILMDSASLSFNHSHTKVSEFSTRLKCAPYCRKPQWLSVCQMLAPFPGELDRPRAMWHAKLKRHKRDKHQNLSRQDCMMSQMFSWNHWKPSRACSEA